MVTLAAAPTPGGPSVLALVGDRSNRLIKDAPDDA